MLDSLRPFVIPALSAKGQKLAFMTRGPFSCRRRGGGTAAVPGGTKAGVPCMGAGSNAQAWAGCGTGAQIIRTGTVFQCAPTAADPAAAVRGELTEVGAERSVQQIGDCRCSAAEIFRQAMCAARSCISIQQARLTMHGGNFYQLALRTPGIWPLNASSRKQIRQMP